MKLAVIGSREFSDYALLKQTLVAYPQATTIVSGGAKGADALAEQYAEQYDLEILIFKPSWKKYGRGAGVVRNKDIVNASDAVVAFWDGASRGTKSSIDYAKKMGKPIQIVKF